MFVFPRLDCHKNTQVGEREGVLSAVMTEQLVPFVHEEKLLLMTLTHLAFGGKGVLLRSFPQPRLSPAAGNLQKTLVLQRH